MLGVHRVESAIGRTKGMADEPLEASMEDAVEKLAPPADIPSTQVTAQQKPARAGLNLGQWETAEADEGQSLDFGFGSFGPDGGDASVDETTHSSKVSDAAKAAAVSPARPPPGLGLDMPPMPTEGVVNVHELEANLERSSLGPAAEAKATKPQAPAPPPASVAQAPQPVAAVPGMAQGYTTGAPGYGGMGMYNANGGFLGQQV